MSILISAFSSVVIQFINDTIIPILDKNNTGYNICIQKWGQFTQNVMKKISNIKTQQELKQRVKLINKINKKQLKQKTNTNEQSIQSNDQNQSIRVTFTQTDKTNKINKTQDINNKVKQPISKLRQQSIQFRDRKTSLDQLSSNKKHRQQQQSQIILRKQQRSGSFNSNSLDNDIIVQIPLILTPKQQLNQQPRNSYPRKQNQVLSFNSISDFHKSRNNIPSANKQLKDSQLPLIQPQQLKMMSKKSIEDFSITQARPNSYSSNYIESIKKINIQSRSPNQKSKNMYSQLQTSQDYVQTTPVKLQQTQSGGSALSNIKKKISQGSDYLNSPPPMNSNNQSFSKFMNSFKKLCNTFQSNHQKLLREDFNNKYINC